MILVKTPPRANFKKLLKEGLGSCWNCCNEPFGRVVVEAAIFKDCVFVDELLCLKLLFNFINSVIMLMVFGFCLINILCKLSSEVTASVFSTILIILLRFRLSPCKVYA